MKTPDKVLTSIGDSVDVSSYNLQNENIATSEVYTEGIFKKFNRYCIVHNLNKMGDLKDFDFKSLSDIRGFGKERVKRITLKYNSIMFGNLFIPNSTKLVSTPSLDDDISEVFDENKYNIFRQFCSANGYKTIGDLMRLNFEDLLSVEGIGTGKLAKIKAKCLEFTLLGNDPQVDLISNNTYGLNAPSFNIHPDYIGVDISFVFGSKTCRVLRKRHIETISDFAKITAMDFQDVPKMGTKKISEALAHISLYELPISEFVATSFANIRKEEEYQCYREVVYNKKTLEQVGNELGLTRERIRQKKNKIEQSALPIVSIFEEVVIKSGLLDNTIIFNFELLSDLLSSYDSATFAKDIFASCELKHIKYSPDFDLFFIDKNPEEIIEKLRNIAIKLGDIILFSDEMVRIEEMLTEYKVSFIDVFSFPEYLLKFGYKKYRDYYLKGRASLPFMSEIVLLKHFSNGIDNTNENISKMRDMIALEFGVVLSDDDNDRNLWAALDRPTSNIVLWGKSKRIHIDHVIIGDVILEKIKDRLSQELATLPSISSDYIYEQVKDLLQTSGSNICCKEALYGVLKHYFSELFSFRKLTIKTAENTSNVQMMLEKFITQNNGIVSMDIAKGYFSQWTDAMFNAAINFNNNILTWDGGDSLILSSTLRLPDGFTDQFKEKIDDSFIDGYTNAYMITRAAKVLLLRSQLKDDAVSVYSLARHLFSEKYFFTRRPHILAKVIDKQFTTVDLVLALYKQKTVLSYGEMKEQLIHDYAVDDVAAGNHIAKAIPLLFQLDIDRYCLPGNVAYGQETVDACIASVEALMSPRGFVILSEIDKSDLCRHSITVAGNEYLINAYVVKAIIAKEKPNKYRFILRKNHDWRYDNQIIVPATSSINTFTDAIIYLLVNEFEDKENFTLPNINSFLLEKELIVNSIPNEFFNSKRIVIDEFDRVSIREEGQDVI